MSLLEYASPGTRNSKRLGPHWLGWAIYLGMSWTWCIGMFLPVLLIRDYGFWAWVVFAVPNVVGAAAMGWVISSDASLAIIQRHRVAIGGFSAVTIGYQLFFASWAFKRLEPFASNADVVMSYLYFLGLCLLLTLVALWERKAAMLAALMVLLASCFYWNQMARDGTLIGFGQVVRLMDAAPPASLGGLTAVSLLGFGLCPYLDSTFLRARAETKRDDAKLAFGVGFGVLFFAMIVLTMLYAPAVARMTQGRFTYWVGRLLPQYWGFQLALTVALHFAELARTYRWRHALSWLVIALILAVLGWFGAATSAGGGEFIYRLFLSFYGLIFPAYVWLCMIPTRGHSKPSAKSLCVFAGACVVAAPMYWMGFIEKQMTWLVPGVAVVLLARVLLGRKPEMNDTHAPITA